jgi:hypothetical protein
VRVLARATACSVHGLAGVPVLVEADITNGLPNFSVVDEDVCYVPPRHEQHEGGFI